MISFSLIKEALSALWVNRLRSSLTILGMIMGVTSVIAIVSVVEGMQYDIERSLNTMGPTTFTATRFGLVMSWAEYLERMRRKKLTRDLIPIIEEGCPDCENVGAEGYASDHLKYGSDRMRWVEIRGETPNLLEMRAFDVMMGRYLNWEDEERRKQVAFIGYEVYEKFFLNEDPIGKRIKVGEREFVVIGVAEKLGGTLVDGIDDFAAIPLSTLQKIYRQPGNPVNLVVKARSLETRQRAIDQVRVVLRSARGVPYGDEDDFSIFTPDALLSFINDITRAFKAIMISLPLMSIVIGGIVIMNIMMISVTERTKEIGIRKSIGARRRHILIQFLYESLILSLVGSLIGIALGIKLGTMMLTSWMDIYFTPTAMAIILGAGIAMGVGLFFGIYPARKASRLDPIKALTYE
jgi:putative ABC transport system permease protein